ncbi:uncharacterized protein LOC136040828 isoform X3 [Artemia franciscana]|uniref:uncharacterized protein LOC136040828 isoform X3 n=1 Tax=Artemia franciscana TaxID=6661 RepID=UPI0032DAA568
MEDQQEESSVLQSLLDQGPTTSQRHASPEHLMSGQSKPFISDVDFEKFNGNVSPRQEDKIDPTPASTCISKIYNASASQRHASQEHLMSGQSKPFISDVDFEKFNGNVSPRQEDKNDPTPAENLRNQQITQPRPVIPDYVIQLRHLSRMLVEDEPSGDNGLFKHQKRSCDRKMVFSATFCNKA